MNGLHAEMPHDYDWKPDKQYKNLWWKLLLISGIKNYILILAHS